MPIQKLVALPVLFFAAALSAQSPSFDCSKAATPQEKAICASPRLRRADAAMNTAYKAWLAAAPADWKDAIRQSQRLWLRQRRTSCKPGDKDNPLAKCLLNQEQSRTKELRGRVERRDGILFVWQPLTRTEPDSADVAKMMRENGQPDYGTITAAWPQAQSATPEWQAWNKAIAAEVLNSNSQEDNSKKIDLRQASTADSDTDISVTLSSVTDSLVSAEVGAYWYGHGAAHPNHGVSQFNWLLKEQRELKGSDVFKGGIYWSNELYKRVDQYLHKTLDSDGQSYETFAQPGEMKKTVQTLVADPQRWQMDAKGITIAFNPYEVACYACTPEPFTMSWESLKPMLNPAFQIPAVSSLK